MKRERLQAIDSFCTAPTNYALLTYKKQFYSLLWRVVHRQDALRNAAIFLWQSLQFCWSIALTPLCFLAHMMGYRFLSVDLKQIGSILWLDLYLRDNFVEAKVPRNKIIVARSRYTDANVYGLDLYKPYVTYIYEPWIKFLLYPFFMNVFFQVRMNPYEHTAPMRKNFDHNAESRAQSVFQRYREEYGAPLCRLASEEITRGTKELSTIMNFDRPFVTLHMRDSGFYKEARKSLRNGDIHACELAIQYLIEQGYTVVRAGTKSATPIDDMLAKYKPHLVDYARSSVQSDFLDCFLASQCEFYIGGSSGYSYVPAVFETSSCFVDFYNVMLVLGFSKSDLSSFKKFRYIKSGQLVPFHDIVREPLTRNLSADELAALGIEVVDNTPQDILYTVKEFLAHNPDAVSPEQLEAKRQMPVWNYCYKAEGNFSRTILDGYNLNEKPMVNVA